MGRAGTEHAGRVRMPSGGAFQRLWMLPHRPPGWVLHGATAVLALVYLWSFSFPGYQGGGLVTLMMIAMVLGPVWLIRTAAYGLTRWRWPDRAGGHPVRCAVLPAALLVAALLVHQVDLPHRARFALSRGALDRAVDACVADRDEAGRCDDGRIGWYSMGIVQYSNGGVIFHVSGTGVFEGAGLAHAGGGDVNRVFRHWSPQPDVRQITGDWYAWS